MTDSEKAGGCLCGAVRYRIAGAPLAVVYCHCTDCRRASGAPVSLFVEVPEGAFAVTQGTPAVHASSPGVRRSFCSRCGAPLTYRSERFPGEVHVVIGSFDTPGDFAPERHVWSAEALSWFHVADDLPRT